MADPPADSYIDYDTFLADDFSAVHFANTLVAKTHNASDTVVDLSTPLSKVLFDVQEVDTNVHSLTTSNASALLEHARQQTSSAQTVLAAVQEHVARLTARYAQLDTDVVQRHAVAEEVRLAAARLWVTVKIGRAVQRALLLGRQLDANMEDAFRASAAARPPSRGGDGVAATATTTTATNAASATPSASSGSDEAAALVRAAHSVLALKALLQASGAGEEGEHLGRINVIATLRTDLLSPAEQRLRARSQQVIREFSLSSTPSPSSDSLTASPSRGGGGTSSSASSISASTAPTPASFAQSAAARARTAAAAQALYLLSPISSSASSPQAFTPTLLNAALEAYLRAALTASANGLARALAALSTLPRALAEVAARCQNVGALERLLADVRPPAHALLAPQSAAGRDATAHTSLLDPLLESLDTHSLPSYFWRSLAGDVGARVTDLLNRGGVGARQLRASREKLRELLREAVLRGCEGARVPTAMAGKEKEAHRTKRWEREVQVMVGSVVGPLSR